MPLRLMLLKPSLILKHRSISERLARAKSPEARASVLSDWVSNWRDDQLDIVRQLEQAIQTMDYNAFCSATGQLKAVTEKRLDALQKIFEKLRS